MAMGTLALACLMLVTGAAPDVWPMNQRSFQIPIHVDPARRGDLKELVLYSSSDQGRSWQQVGVATPDKEAFTFYASGDGLYWFSVVAVDQQGNREPPDIYKAPPGSKILVDTVKPLLRIVSADRQGDDVIVSWDMQEENPDLATLKLEYRTADMPSFQWNPVTVNQATSGQAKFTVHGTGAVSVRMQVQDLAQNVASAQTDVAASAGGQFTPSSPGTTTASFTATPVNTSTLPPPPTQGTGAGLSGSAWERMQSSPPRTDPHPAQERPYVPPPPSYNPPTWGSAPEGNSRLVASTDSGSGSVSSVPPPAPNRAPRGPLPNLTMVNTPQITIEYEVAKFGPSGVGSVELYMSRDDGATWQRFATDQNVQMPSPGDLGGMAGPVRRPLTVDLPGEGIYGFYLVVRSGAGLGKPPPQNGDPPQMRVELDTTRPVAQLFAPEAIPGQRNALLISWTASDRNIAPNPILLQWAERQGGPWETIGTELPNNGHFTWKLPPNLPYRVYLRLSARDTAGNVSVAETREPVLVDLNEPEGMILGIAGVGRRP